MYVCTHRHLCVYFVDTCVNRAFNFTRCTACISGASPHNCWSRTTLNPSKKKTTPSTQDPGLDGRYLCTTSPSRTHTLDSSFTDSQQNDVFICSYCYLLLFFAALIYIFMLLSFVEFVIAFCRIVLLLLADKSTN